MSDLTVRAAGDADAEAVRDLLVSAWGSTTIVSHRTTYDAAALPAFVAEADGRLAGLVTYDEAGDAVEVVTLNAVERHGGVGTRLLDAVVEYARGRDARRVWLITTNDNVDALRFYQRRGMRIISVAPGAVDAARETKAKLGAAPIPETGDHGIALHDELTLELCLD